MKVLYARVQDEQHDYVTEIARTSGLSIAKIVDGILADARQRGVTIQSILIARVREDEHVPGT